MTRSTLRAAAALALAAAVPLAAVLWDPRAAPPTPRTNVTLVYVGADDCAPCRASQSGDGRAFAGSAEFGRLSYREVKSPTVRDLLKDEHWPDDLRGHRGRLGREMGVPLWLVISGDEVVERAFGASQWQAVVLPRIKSLLR
jgi:hypothetical protein